MLLGSLMVFTPGGLGPQNGLAPPRAESLVALAFFTGGIVTFGSMAARRPCLPGSLATWGHGSLQDWLPGSLMTLKP